MADRAVLQVDQAEPSDQDLPGTSENAVMAQIWAVLVLFLLVAYFKFLIKIKISMAEMTMRLGEHLMRNGLLLEFLSLDRKTLAKPPDWNTSRLLELFEEFFYMGFFIGQH